MIEKNKNYIATVCENGFGGEGIVKTKDGFTVFVPYALKGEEIEYKAVKVLKTHGFGKLIKVITPSPCRTEPVCPVFNRCGGCNFLHMDYKRTLEIKQNQVYDCMKKYAHIDPLVLPVLGMENPFNYRNKAMYQAEGESFGFYAQRSHTLIPIDQCYMQNKKDKKIIEAVRDYARKYNPPIKTLFTRYGEKECMVTVVTSKESLPAKDYLISRLMKANGEIVSIYQNINKTDTNTLLGEKNILLYGKEQIEAKINDTRLIVSPHSFLQINPTQTQKLYSIAKQMGDFTGNETIFDLYCGAGSIGLFMAPYVKKVIGVENVAPAVKDAFKNKELNQIENIDFICGTAEDVVPQLIEDGKIPDAVILDPPRKGCAESLIKLLIEQKIPKIIYISCNPATLARDIDMLKEHYSLSPIQPVDMFPFTSHVECVVKLCR